MIFMIWGWGQELDWIKLWIEEKQLFKETKKNFVTFLERKSNIYQMPGQIPETYKVDLIA